jgi:hypothetical protein
METVSIVLNVAKDKASEFERAFVEHEYPLWEEYHGRGDFIRASLSRMSDIADQPVEGAQQYLLIAVVPSRAQHNAHDEDPRFLAWLELAKTFQIAPPVVAGGDTFLQVG